MTTMLPAALADVISERARQDAKWGEQNHDLTVWLTVLAEEVERLRAAGAMAARYYHQTQFERGLHAGRWEDCTDALCAYHRAALAATPVAPAPNSTPNPTAPGER